MPQPNRPRALGATFLLLCCALGVTACGTERAVTRRDPLEASSPRTAAFDDLQVQSLVMSMADTYGAALGEAIYLIVRSERVDAKGRWLSQSFLRNGMGATLDIAAGPNPRVGLLDLLVLASLQSWSFEKHWIESGIDAEIGRQALDRLRAAEAELWESSRRVLSEAQIETLHGLVRNWIDAHPDRTVVSLVRFDEFTDQRRQPVGEARAAASGLLADVEKAATAVEDAQLLGERLIWFAGRLPYVLGQQAELTAYRLADQPEAVLARDALAKLTEILGAVAERSRTLDQDLLSQQAEFFARLREERKQTFDDLATRVVTEREATIDQAFDRLSHERRELLGELESRLSGAQPALAEVRGTIEVSNVLAQNLTQTAQALDAVIQHFDRAPGDTRRPLDFERLTNAAVEATKTAQRLTDLLERTDADLDSPQGQARLDRLGDLTSGVLDGLFWRAAGLVALLLAGLAALRLLPKRSS